MDSSRRGGGFAFRTSGLTGVRRSKLIFQRASHTAKEISNHEPSDQKRPKTDAPSETYAAEAPHQEKASAVNRRRKNPQGRRARCEPRLELALKHLSNIGRSWQRPGAPD